MKQSKTLLSIAAVLATAAQSVWLLGRLVAADDAGPTVVETSRPPRLSFELEDRLLPGLIVRFEQVGPDGASQRDARHARLAALHVPADDAPTPFLFPGPFQAIYEGYLLLDLKSTYTFRLEGRGSVELQINQTKILSTADEDLARAAPVSVQLHQDFNPLRLTYRSPEDGNASFRLIWESESMMVEPVPPVVLWHDSEDRQLGDQARLRRGRELFATRNCARCHKTEEGPSGNHGMPEMVMDNPRMLGIGRRLNAHWMFHRIQTPTAMRNRTTMPAVLQGDEAATRRQAADIVAYLTTLDESSPPSTASDSGTAEQATSEEGAVLFETLGCISCHHVEPLDAEDLFDRVSLHYVNAKFRPGALIEFLQFPQRHYVSSRMPDFQLDLQEATALASLLRANAKGELSEPDELAHGDVDRGREQFRAVGCANCHEIDGKPTSVEQWEAISAPPQKRGCLADDEAQRGRAPQHDLTTADRAALDAFLSTDRRSLSQVSWPEASARLMASIRCINCHPRDDETSLWPEILAEESELGQTEETIPALTWTGEKLRNGFLQKQLVGTLSYRSRPWLKARMPAFAGQGAALAIGLAAEHGFGTGPRDEPRPDPDLAKIGQRLTQQNVGFFCVECHAVGDQSAVGAFQHHGVNFARVAERVHHSYYRRWITDPTRVNPGSKMPQFSPDGKTSTIKDVLEGDAQRQFNALWSYLISWREKS